MGKSSKDKRDAYYRLAKEQGWRARSAYKLLQLDEEFDLFADVTRVVDLCAAPGSWSQVLSRVLIKGEKFGRSAWEDKQEKIRQQLLRLHTDEPSPEELQKSEAEVKEQELEQEQQPNLQPRKDVKIVAIDLQPMSPLPGITTLRADITHPATIPLLLHALDPTSALGSGNPSHPAVDLVLSDGAPDVTGLHDLDIYVQSQLLLAALNLTLCVLRPGGTFVAKIFRGRDVDLLFAQLRVFFTRVVVAKPRSSRASSVEAFIVCRNFSPPEGFRASLEEPQRFPIIARDSSSPQVGDEVKVQGNLEDGDAGHVEEITLPAEPQSEPQSESESQSKTQRSNRWIAPFLACGELSAFDADASYHLPRDRITLDPVQPPTAPPYKRALEMRKAAGGAYGKTSLG